MTDTTVSAVLTVVGGLVGGAIAGVITVWAERRRLKFERAKLLSHFTSLVEVEKARILSYGELWRCLDGISTYRPTEIVSQLSNIQENLQKWYYAAGGGLLIAGAAERKGSTKAAFFAARDLKSQTPLEIWKTFHRLRLCLRRDLRIFDDPGEEAAALDHTKAKLKQME